MPNIEFSRAVHRCDAITGSRWRLIRGLIGIPLLFTAGFLAAQAEFQLDPADAYQATGFPRGPIQPSSKDYVLTNAGISSAAWVAIKDQPWFSVSAYDGVLESGATANLQVFLNGQSLILESGLHEGLLVITNESSSNGTSLSVSLDLSLPGPGSVEFVLALFTNQLRLAFTGEPGRLYILEGSDDLERWTPMETNVFESSDAAFKVDLEAAPQRFFRTLTPGTNAVAPLLTLTNAFFEDLNQIKLIGDSGGTYLVESTLDDTNWVAILTNQLPFEGSVIFTNPLSGGETGWTYRATALEPFPAETLHHVLIIGQSLALGIGGSPALSVIPSERHFRFSSEQGLTYLIRLVETGLESIASGAGANLSGQSNHRLVFSNTSVGGAVYDELKKGTTPYEHGILQIKEAPAGIGQAMMGHVPTAIFVVHGEGDHIDPDYDLNIRQWQADYEADIRNVTGLDVVIPMFHSQASAWTSEGNGSAEFTLGAFKVLDESERNPDQTILVCPKYFLPYSDGIHLTNTSYRWLGEYYAKAYRAVVVEGGTWAPLKPNRPTRVGNVITVQFDVPVPPLVLDTNWVSDPGDFGFQYWDESAEPPVIESVELDGQDLVRVTLSAVPTGASGRLRYAFSGEPGNPGGPNSGPRGNLRDSDLGDSPFGNPLYNWCVHFDKLVKPVE